MQLTYRYFYGGDYNPFAKEAQDAYRKLSEERKIADRGNELPPEKTFPTLRAWPQYVIAESKSTFWQMERAISLNSEDKADEIATIWKEAIEQKKVDRWILAAESDDAGKAMCFYMKVLHMMFAPNDNTVDFRLYFSESREGRRLNEGRDFSLTPYDG